MHRGLFLSLALFASPALAGDAVTYETDEAVEDAAFAIENAIIGEGLVIDLHSHVGDMLERTRADVGGEPLYTRADIFSFCSATVSRKVMEADLTNIHFCPYKIFVYATHAEPGKTVVGYDRMPEGPMKEVEALLERIVRTALDM